MTRRRATTATKTLEPLQGHRILWKAGSVMVDQQCHYVAIGKKRALCGTCYPTLEQPFRTGGKTYCRTCREIGDDIRDKITAFSGTQPVASTPTTPQAPVAAPVRVYGDDGLIHLDPKGNGVACICGYNGEGFLKPLKDEYRYCRQCFNGKDVLLAPSAEDAADIATARALLDSVAVGVKVPQDAPTLTSDERELLAKLEDGGWHSIYPEEESAYHNLVESGAIVGRPVNPRMGRVWRQEARLATPRTAPTTAAADPAWLTVGKPRVSFGSTMVSVHVDVDSANHMTIRVSKTASGKVSIDFEGKTISPADAARFAAALTRACAIAAAAEAT